MGRNGPGCWRYNTGICGRDSCAQLIEILYNFHMSYTTPGRDLPLLFFSFVFVVLALRLVEWTRNSLMGDGSMTGWYFLPRLNNNLTCSTMRARLYDTISPFRISSIRRHKRNLTNFLFTCHHFVKFQPYPKK